MVRVRMGRPHLWASKARWVVVDVVLGDALDLARLLLWC